MKEMKRLKHLKRVKRFGVLSPGFSRPFVIPDSKFQIGNIASDDKPLLTRGPLHSEFRLSSCSVFLWASRVRENTANIGNIANNGNIGNTANIGNIANIRDEWDKWDNRDIWNTRPCLEICDVGFGTLDLHRRIVNC